MNGYASSHASAHLLRETVTLQGINESNSMISFCSSALMRICRQGHRGIHDSKCHSMLNPFPELMVKPNNLGFSSEVSLSPTFGSGRSHMPCAVKDDTRHRIRGTEAMEGADQYSTVSPKAVEGWVGALKDSSQQGIYNKTGAMPPCLSNQCHSGGHQTV